jgi:hypothetical protein
MLVAGRDGAACYRFRHPEGGAIAALGSGSSAKLTALWLRLGLSRSGASTEPRYSPLRRMMLTRQLQLATVGFFLAVFMCAGRQP